MNDSWGTFAQALAREAQALANLNVQAESLTRSLVRGAPAEIAAADAAVNAARLAHQFAASRRRGMQARGFGSLTLEQVCRYAPQPQAPRVEQVILAMRTGATALGLTVSNNKALILAGFDRLRKVTARMQSSFSERPGVYERRGSLPPPARSVLVSSEA